MPNVYDGFESLQNGMNAAVEPSLIQKTEIARGVNVDLRDGRPRTRKSFVRHTMTGAAGIVKTIEDGKYQGGSTYRYAGKDYIVFGVSGRIYMMDAELMSVTDITPTGGAMNSLADRLFFCQANEYMIIQDGFNVPIIAYGFATRLSTGGTDPTEPEVPAGKMMAFGQGRLFVVVEDKYIMAGDIYLPWEPDKVLKFTETTYLNGGGAFGLPAWMGNIKGLAFQPNVVSGTGLGSLVVFAEKGICSFGVQAARTTWNSTDIARVLYQDCGGTGPASIVSVGNDLFYLATDGLRSMKLSYGESQGNGTLLQSLPLSRKVQTIVDDETPWAYQFASGVVHDNRLYFTSVARQRKVTNHFALQSDDYYFECLLTVDLRGLAGLPMLFEGITTGFKFLQVFEVERFDRKQLLCLGLGNTNTIGVFIRSDESRDNLITRPECRIYTAALNFETASPIQKKFLYAEIWLSEMRDVIDMDVYYRPEGYPIWFKAGSSRFVGKDDATGEYNVYGQVRQKIRISEDTKGLSPELSELRNALIGAKIQFCFSWRGQCQLDRVLVVAEPQPDDSRMGNSDIVVNELTGTALMDYDYLAA